MIQSLALSARTMRIREKDAPNTNRRFNYEKRRLRTTGKLVQDVMPSSNSARGVIISPVVARHSFAICALHDGKHVIVGSGTTNDSWTMPREGFAMSLAIGRPRRNRRCMLSEFINGWRRCVKITNVGLIAGETDMEVGCAKSAVISCLFS